MRQTAAPSKRLTGTIASAVSASPCAKKTLVHQKSAAAGKTVTTPAKRQAPPPGDDETPDDKKQRPSGFGGKCGKVDGCKVCGHARDQSQRGSSCDYCLLACRRLFQHQRLSEVLDCASTTAQLKGVSAELRQEAAEKPVPGPSPREVKQLVQQVKELVAFLPRIEGLVSRVEKLEARP